MVGKLIITVLSCILACSCGDRTAKEALEIKVPENCDTLYVILPGNFIIDLAAGAEVTINPAAQQFALFCSPQDAQAAIDSEVSAGHLGNARDWNVYEVDGKFSEIANTDSEGHYYLTRTANIVDWVQ